MNELQQMAIAFCPKLDEYLSHRGILMLTDN
ncbi:hypothetical protein J2067_004836 [Erwinia rhapontici]|nr:hypothetical protein [Erwinia rhapontici]